MIPMTRLATISICQIICDTNIKFSCLWPLLHTFSSYFFMWDIFVTWSKYFPFFRFCSQETNECSAMLSWECSNTYIRISAHCLWSINYSQTIHLQLVTFSIQIIICGVKLYRTGNKCWCDKWVRCCGEMQEILIKCHSPSPRNEHLKTKNAFIVFVSERRNINSGRHWMKTSGNKIWRNLTPFLFASPRQKPLWNTPAVLLTEQNCPTQENQHQNIELKNQKLFRLRISLKKKNRCNSKEEKWNLFDFWMRLDPTPLSLMRG